MRIIRYFSIILLFFQVCFVSGYEFTPDITLLIPMRDGTELPTDLYFPKECAGQRLPCILIRSPPGRKTKPWQDYSALAQLGYVVAIQDTRSAADKEGKTLPFWSDGWNREQDGYDTTQWLAKSIFTNGDVGTFGFSAAGITQLMMAPTTPPALKCQYMGMAWASIYHNAIFPGGQALKSQIEGWLGMYAPDAGVMNNVFSQPFYNDFWNQFNTVSVADKVNVPALMYTGWYDTALQGMIDAFASRQYHGGKGALGTQKLVIGPWTHYWPFSFTLGDFPVPEQGKNPPLDISPGRWFDHYLKGVQNGVDQLAAVNYYVMGPLDGTSSSGNVWKQSAVWPVPHKHMALYLTKEGRLSKEAHPDKVQRPFLYDPAHPVPTIGGRNLFIESGAKDQRPIEGRNDVLVFTSEELIEDLEVTGQVFAKVFISSNRHDVDVVVRLTDVYPDGRSVLIADGLTRTGPLHCLNGFDCTKAPQEITIDLWSTSLVFAKGHRIRVSISGSNYPRYECNANIGVIGTNSGKYLVAHNTLYLGGETNSFITLPVIK